ncbi:hypothetical protein ACGFNU_10465 [Spirillospora sp. NPDC048911]|uniref:hypothetical protein n=1 Tax=Spirillospora sp. NPDC048911 TaxID=3364527 RepID=UPI0037118686
MAHLGKGNSRRQFAPVRAAASLLVSASAALYLTVAAKGLLRLTTPPTQMVVMTATGPQPVGPAETASPTLYGPLAIVGALLAGLLLVWAGASGLRTARDQRAWRRHQSLALIAYALGTIAFGFAHLGVTGTQVIWDGPNPLIPSTLLALLVAAATIALPTAPTSPDADPRHPVPAQASAL